MICEISDFIYAHPWPRAIDWLVTLSRWNTTQTLNNALNASSNANPFPTVGILVQNSMMRHNAECAFRYIFEEWSALFWLFGLCGSYYMYITFIAVCRYVYMYVYVHYVCIYMYIMYVYVHYIHITFIDVSCETKLILADAGALWIKVWI